MSRTRAAIIIAHALTEEHLAEELAGPLRDAGYEVHHTGTVLVGESIIAEVQKLLGAGAPVVLCGTVRAVGTPWARRVVNAAHSASRTVRVFAVQMEDDADLDALAFDSKIANWGVNRNQAIADLLAGLEQYYPTDAGARHKANASAAEERYRELMLESCDLIDLMNLPEGDRHIATRHLELRRLYVALRVHLLRDSENVRSDVGGPGQDEERKLHSIGEVMSASGRVVVLGDPGSGKTTMLRWIVTAYLLQLAKDPDWRDLPDVGSLPTANLLPVLIRCRDLEPSNIGGSIDDILRHIFRQQELTEAETSALCELIRSRLADGTALLCVDGLDEVSDPLVRARLCRQVERVSLAFPSAPVLVTSRIVGYREMGYRIGRDFQHVVVADLRPEDKDSFVTRWSQMVEPPERHTVAALQLIAEIHSTPRIEALTGNPMLLTTMALVKRKIGKLPSRRADLYWETVQVLLNWRQEVDLPLDVREALPQLEYLAYAMCSAGVQRLREDEVLELLSAMRREYPQLYSVHRRPVDEFLHAVEARTGLLVEAGYERHRGVPVPVHEFRHLTFQEFLAARAIVEGHLPDHDPSVRVAQRIAPLVDHRSESRVVESWHEVLRLCVASCSDSDVDSALNAILSSVESVGEASYASRAFLAAQCLTDEPNVSPETFTVIIDAFLSAFLAGAETEADYDSAEFSFTTTWRSGGLEDRSMAQILVNPRWRSAAMAAALRHFTGEWNMDASLLHLLVSRDPWERPLSALAEAFEGPDPAHALEAGLSLLYRVFPEDEITFGDIADSGVICAVMTGLRRDQPLALLAIVLLCAIHHLNRPGFQEPVPERLEDLWAATRAAEAGGALSRLAQLFLDTFSHVA